MAPPTIRVLGHFSTNAAATLWDVRTAQLFVRELLDVLEGPPLATFAQDVAAALAEYGHVPTPDERGVWAGAYSSKAGVVIRTLAVLGQGRVEAHSYAHPIEPAIVHALVHRHYGTRSLRLQDLGHHG